MKDVVPASAHRREPAGYGLSFVCFVSGAAGLVFEVVWFYRCSLVFGNSAWATSIVLSSFMGGLAAGNAAVVRYGPRIGRFLRTYAVLEILVAVSSVALTYCLTGLTSLFGRVMNNAVEIPWLVNLVRAGTAFVILLLPASAMGTTLPVLLGVRRRRDGFGRALGRLYGWNTLGAVVGVIGTEIVLVPRVGVTGSAWIAALANLSAATAALWISRRVDENGQRPNASTSVDPATSLSVSWWLSASAFLAGGALMALEGVWFRFLSMFVASNTLAMSVMLAAVLAAIGLGGLAASSWLKHRPSASAHLPAVALAAGCLVVTSYASFQLVVGDTKALEWNRVLWLAVVLTFPTSLLSGVVFTLLGEAIKRGDVTESASAAWLILANTLGAMCGSAMAVFVLLPFLGMERAFFALAIAYCGVAVLAARARDASQPRSTAVAWAMGLAGVTAAVIVTTFPFGLMSRTYFARVTRAYTEDGSVVVATREGSVETVFLTEQIWRGQPAYYRLVTNGISMSATTPKATRYMRYFAYLPDLLHNGPLRHALVIGYGIGITTSAIEDIRSIDSIDVAEISRDVVKMSGVVYPGNGNPLRDPRVHLHVEDGRYFLETSGEHFDLVTGEPPPPLTPDAVNIYTREYFKLIHDHLAEGGIATYWLPVARVAGTNHAAIIRAFCEIFEDCSLWNGTPADLMLVGTQHAAGPISAAPFSTAWDDPVLGSHLRESGFEQPEQIGATFIGDASYLGELTMGAAPLTDDFPRRIGVPVGVSLSDARRSLDWSGTQSYQELIDPRRARLRFETSAFVRHLWPKTLLADTLPFFEIERVINSALTNGAGRLDIGDVHVLLTQTRLQTLPAWMLGASPLILDRVGTITDDGTGEVSYLRGVRALVARKYETAAAYLKASKDRDFGGSRLLLAYSLCLAGHIDAAKELAARPDSWSSPGDAQLWAWLSATFGEHFVQGPSM